MPITNQTPNSSINFSTWVSPSPNISNYEGVLLAQYIKGGYQNVITLEDRDAISIYNEGTQEQHIGFTNSGDGGKTTGLRSLGMMVKVLDPEGDGSVESKVYVLIPYGYFGNNGSLGWDSWSSLPEWEKAKRMKPSATVYTDQVAGGPPPLPVEYLLPESQTEDDCWIELIQFTEHPLPSGGSAGELLAKIDSDDHNVGWVSPTALQGPPGVDGLNGSVESSWIGNMFTHPNFPGSNGLSGLMTEGDVNVSTGDIFSINVYGADDAPVDLNGTFIATEDFIMPQATTGATAIFNILAKWNFTFEAFSQAILPIQTIANNFTVTISSNSKFEINGVEQDTLTLVRGLTYYFDTSSIDTNTHPFALSATDDGIHNGGGLYTYGATYSPAGSLSFIIKVDNLVIDTLYYFCANHAGMGGTINVINPTDYSDTKAATFLNGNLNSHIIPDANATYDIGSAEYKIRHLFLSDNSLTMGDTILDEIKILNTLNFSLDTVGPADYSDPAGGIKGDIRFDLNYLYICVEDGQWKRVAFDNGWLP